MESCWPAPAAAIWGGQTPVAAWTAELRVRSNKRANSFNAPSTSKKSLLFSKRATRNKETQRGVLLLPAKDFALAQRRSGRCVAATPGR